MKDGMGGHRVYMGEITHAEKSLVLKPKGKRMLGRPDHR
jgi:hypothetical protein